MSLGHWRRDSPVDVGLSPACSESHSSESLRPKVKTTIISGNIKSTV